MRTISIERCLKAGFLVLAIALSCLFLNGCTHDNSVDGSSEISSSSATATGTQNTQSPESPNSTASEISSNAESNIDQDINMKELEIIINGKSFIVSVEDNETAHAFVRLLPLNIDMKELNGNEKYYFLPESLPSDPTSVDVIEAGDVMLYQDNCIVIFYESHPTSYKYTRIGKIDDADGLVEALGKGSAEVDFKAL